MDAGGGGSHKRRQRGRAGRKRHHLIACFGDQHRVLPLRRQAAVLGDDGPAVVAKLLDLAPAGVDHGLDGEHHAGLELFERAGAAIVQHLGFFVEYLANAVAAELAHHRKAVPFGEFLDGVSDVAQVRAGAHLLDTQPHGVISNGGQALGGNRALANQVHAAVVAIPAILGDDGDVHVDDVALLERLVVGDAVAHHMVDRGAQRARIRRIARWLVAHGGRNGALGGHAFGAQAVDFERGDAGLDVRCDVVQHFRSQPAGEAHAGDVLCGFDGDTHAAIIPSPLKPCRARAWRCVMPGKMAGCACSTPCVIGPGSGRPRGAAHPGDAGGPARLTLSLIPNRPLP